MEQYVRDARIAQIYEGTNGVQAMDLVGRKLALDGGTLTQRFFALIRAELDAALPTAGEGRVAPVALALARRDRVTRRRAGRGRTIGGSGNGWGGREDLG